MTSARRVRVGSPFWGWTDGADPRRLLLSVVQSIDLVEEWCFAAVQKIELGLF
jgi:hypothetical protein